MGSPPESTARFTPSQLASAPRRALVFVVGPLLWLLAFTVVAAALNRGRAIEIGLTVTLIAFLIALVFSALARRRRLREEQEAAVS